MLLLAVLAIGPAVAQRDLIRGLGNRVPNLGGGGGGGRNDSVVRRDKFEDSITIHFRFLDSTRNFYFDSSVSDYTSRFPIPADHIYLGNVGTASRSLLFSPRTTNGWDPGFHAFDVYKWHLDRIRFFNTTRPYTELSYTLGSQSQQLIDVLHTQNIRPYWNFSLQYRLINAPGFFKNQRTNHNNYLLSSWYQSQNKRYNNYLVVLANHLQAGENGGITDVRLLDTSYYSERFGIPTKIGGNTPYGKDFFNTTLRTGNRYREFNVLLRQQYDLGRKDSLVTDSTVIPLFYPRLRFEHTFRLGRHDYLFQDVSDGSIAYETDSNYYKRYYNYTIRPGDSVYRIDAWREISNDFSIYQFPDAKNLQQFIRAGITYQLLNGEWQADTASLYNIMVHGEYRNRTRNRKWDVLAYGNLYVNGYNAGDYKGYISLQRFLGRQWGSLQLGFENVNRSPSFQYDRRSSFYFDAPRDFAKENTVHLFGRVSNPKLNLQLVGDYYAITNYLYLTDYYKLRQEAALFNLLRVGALKTFPLSRHWRWYAELYLQQKTGDVALNVPTVFTRNRLAFEGNFFKNLFLSTGLEVRYHTPYRADNYSPMLGRFFFQDSVLVSNRPDVAAFFNFRIRSFKAFIRAENLNSMSFDSSGFGFRENNLAAPDYPYPGMVIRLGIYWSFVN